MITINIKHNISETIRLLDERGRKQIRFATAVALTKTAKLAQAAVVDELRSRFDRPTPYTLKSLYIKPATKQNLQAMVYLKDQAIGGKNNKSLAEIIGHQFTGGTRIRKRIEAAFTRAGLISANEFLVPGEAAKLDQYGNLSKGQTVQVMSQVKVGADALAYKTNSLRSKKNVKAAGAMFWSVGGKLPRGVWMRDGLGVKPVLLVIQQPQYQRRIDMNKIVQGVVDKKFSSEFKSALDSAIATAR